MPASRARHLLANHLRHPPPAAVETLPFILLSIKPHYAHLIAAGQKLTEFRRRFPRNITRARAIFYVTAPTRAIALTASITEVVRAAPVDLWQRFAQTSGTDQATFQTYLTGLATGVALVLESVEEINPPIELTDPRLVDFRPPQSLAVLPPRSPLVCLF
jgi:predicted transcriptional regulator